MLRTAPHAGSNKGFTLIELLIVIGIIGFLAAAVLVAVDPVKRIQDARDSRRFYETNAILNAILNKQVDDRALFDGTNPAFIISHATFAQVIVTSDAGIECNTTATENYPGCNQTLDVGPTSAGRACVANLSALAPDYIASIPIDPRGSGQTICTTGCTTNAIGVTTLGATNTGYYIHRTTGNRIEIGSCSPEQAASISVSR